MRLSASGLMRKRESAQKLSQFSKMYKPNDTATVFYPIYKDPVTGTWEILAAGVWGHPVDMDAIKVKASFIPTHSNIDDRGAPDVPDVTYQFSRIAYQFILGEKQKRLEELGKKDWSAAGQAAYKKAIEDIESDYDSKNNMKAKKAPIQGLRLLVATECLYVPVENDIPQPDKAKLVSQNLSNDKISKLMALLNDPKFGPKDDDRWLEVTYNFTSSRNDKAEAGRANPVGVVPEYRLAARYADAWKIIRPRLDSLPDDAKTIENRNYSFRPVSEEAVLKAISTYCVLNSENLDFVDDEGMETLCRNADTIKSLKISFRDAEKQKKIDDAALAKEEDRIFRSEEKIADLPEAPTINQLAEAYGLSDSEMDGVGDTGMEVEVSL